MTGHKKLSLIEILADSPALREIVNKVDQLAKLNRLLEQKCDPELAKNCRVANLRAGVLILTTPSPATGHLLRFTKSELLTALRSDPEWCHLTSIKIHVRPPVAPSPLGEPSRSQSASIIPKFCLSKNSAEAVKATAAGISYSPLQEALLRLCDR